MAFPDPTVETEVAGSCSDVAIFDTTDDPQILEQVELFHVYPLPPDGRRPPARHADTTLDRAAQIFGRIVAAANVLDRHEQNRSAAYSGLYQTITNLDRTLQRPRYVALPGRA